MERADDLFGICPVTTVQKMIGGKWSILILYHLSHGTMRFGELNRLLPMLTQATLTKQLRSLEEYRLVVRTVYAQVPPKVEYSLSNIGEKFLPVLDAISEWGEEYKKYIHDIQSKII
jgi:DNA-binding HxlR family transcriptional regulator